MPVNTSTIQYGVDDVNTEGLNLHISIPLFTLKERGTTYTWKYVYNTPTYNVTFVPVPDPVPNGINQGTWEIFPPLDFGRPPGPDNWNLVDPYSWYLYYDTVGPTTCIEPYGQGGPDGPTLAPETYQTMQNYRLYDPDGTAHPLAMVAVNYLSYNETTLDPCPGAGPDSTSLNSPTLDGTGAYVDISAEYNQTGYTNNAFWLKDGTKFTLAAPNTSIRQPFGGTSVWGNTVAPRVIQIEDRNGNIIGPDMMQRAGLTSSVSGSTTTYSYIDSNGTSEHIAINYTSVPYSIDDCDLAPTTAPCSVVSGNYTFPASIVLPNGQSYQFTYNQNGHGELTSMTLPTGAVITYTYQREYALGQALNPKANVSYVYRQLQMDLATRTETVSGVSSQWIYTTGLSEYNGAAADITTITDPNGNCTAYVGAGGVGGGEGARISYQGCGSGAVPLKTVTTTYATDTATFPTGFMAVNTRPIQVTTTLGATAPSMVQTSYQTFTWNAYSVTGLPGTRMNPSQISEFDYGATSPTRTTAYTYLSDTGSSTESASKYLALNIVDKLRTKSVYSGSGTGTLLNTTTYDYDNYAGGIVASGAVQHDLTYGNWGNNTSTTVTDAINGKSYVSSYGYEDTGNTVSAKDPLGDVTQYSYADTWSNATCALSSGQGHIYLTKVTNPKQQTYLYSYNSCTGTLASITDPNSDITTMQYDELGRTTSTDYPDGGSVLFTYNDTSPTSMKETEARTSTTAKTTLTIFDGLGRPTQTQINSVPSNSSGTIFTNTAYDGLGNVTSVSNPFYSVSDATYGLTTNTYDGLYRILRMTHPDKTFMSWTYSGNIVSATDEDGNTWQRTGDALGRLTNVVEPNTAVTMYTYDALNDLLTVNQAGLSGSTPRDRAFTFDSLSHLLTSSNPETGSVNYGYDANGNLLTKTDARGVVTTYGYDTLNRLLSKTYSNDPGNTPFSCYQYDLASVQNGIGRLSNQWTQSTSKGACAAAAPASGFLTKRSILAYDTMGRLLQEQQYTPASIAAGKFYSPAYTYDLAGDLITSTDGTTPSSTTPGTPLTFANTIDGVGHLLTVTSNWIDPTHPSPLFSLPATPSTPCVNSSTAPYTPFGSLQNAAYGGGLTLNRGFDTRLRMTCESDAGGNTAATSGTATVTITGAEQVQ
jgi:YD repeat-containing protein